jgi:hypothetical protein
LDKVLSPECQCLARWVFLEQEVTSSLDKERKKKSSGSGVGWSGPCRQPHSCGRYVLLKAYLEVDLFGYIDTLFFRRIQPSTITTTKVGFSFRFMRACDCGSCQQSPSSLLLSVVLNCVSFIAKDILCICVCVCVCACMEYYSAIKKNVIISFSGK